MRLFGPGCIGRIGVLPSVIDNVTVEVRAGIRGGIPTPIPGAGLGVSMAGSGFRRPVKTSALDFAALLLVVVLAVALVVRVAGVERPAPQVEMVVPIPAP
ncbi:hypothetical protein [Actinokineospora sp. HUAS TT18]|uniref:hypothetical protein n=1 Tax=Actinokineospora sp. HUAS TT18 TaxID=3447451 RepID=UPI003F5226F5